MIPTPELNYDRDFSGMVGPADSNADIRPNSAAYALVVEKLGEPSRRWADGTIVVYDQRTIKGFGFQFLGHGSGEQYWWGSRFLFLRFDKGGMLSRYRMFSQPYFDSNFYAIETELTRFVNETGPPLPPTPKVPPPH